MGGNSVNRNLPDRPAVNAACQSAVYSDDSAESKPKTEDALLKAQALDRLA